jgi:hypothetical protein
MFVARGGVATSCCVWAGLTGERHDAKLVRAATQLQKIRTVRPCEKRGSFIRSLKCLYLTTPLTKANLASTESHGVPTLAPDLTIVVAGNGSRCFSGDERRINARAISFAYECIQRVANAGCEYLREGQRQCGYAG